MKSKQDEIEKVLKTLLKQNTQLSQENKKIWKEIAKNKDRYLRKKEKLMNFIYCAVQQLDESKALTPYFENKNMLHDLDESARDGNLSSSEAEEKRTISSKNLKKSTINSRKSSFHLDSVSQLEFQPFNIALPPKYAGTSQTLLKPRNSPFSDSFDEDDLESGVKKQVKTERLAKKGSRRATEIYSEKRIGSTNTDSYHEEQPFFMGGGQTLPLTFPDTLSPIPDLQNYGDFNACSFLDFTKGAFTGFKEEIFSNFGLEDEKV